ncbi:HpcH/HpaI aldolase/citrate lyase family protein [Amycolatopsis sp. GM8]|uniref:HpcH/HpaI aldolase family protein n=1 Tax=Amycolatopsis sp. GM8 TaxID=2896530 RepID=UPI001EFFEA9B|nr:aldolase/citrate lyase family protein [Amycolatopsis sp. GM8]
MSSPDVTEVLAQSGLDFVVLDMQHGLLDPATTAHCIRVLLDSPVAAFVRVPDQTPSLLGRLLDWGADGIVVPMVDDAAQTRAAVAACRYAPGGTRSWGPVRATIRRAVREPAAADAHSLCIPMIETVSAYENITEIVAVDGVDIVMIGPSDLALGMGLHPTLGSSDDRHRQAIQSIIDTAADNRVHTWVQTPSPQEAARMIDAGASMVSVRTDISLLATNVGDLLSTIRAGLPT